MINLFAIPATDQSIFYLSTLFGYVGTVLPVTGEINPLLSVMFKTFNSIVLTVGVIIIIYVTVVGVMKTAGEGEFLGKHWNSLWTPIRVVLGIASLVPAPSGYSAIQIIMMWVIVQGIGAADTIWTTTLNYINIAGSATAAVDVNGTNTRDAMGKLFQGLVCEATARKAYPNPSAGATGGNYFCASRLGQTIPGFCGNTQPYDLKARSKCSGSQCTFQMGPTIAFFNGYCGTLTYCNQETECQQDASSLKCVACKAQTESLQRIVSSMGKVADIFAEADYQYRQFYVKSAFAAFRPSQGQIQRPDFVSNYCSANNIPDTRCCGSFLYVPPGVQIPAALCALGTSLGPGDANNAVPDVVRGIYWPYAISPVASVGNNNFIDINITDYSASILAAINQQLTQQAAQSQALPAVLETARQVGWMFAGSYYYNIAQMNKNNLQQANPTFIVAAPGGSDPSSDVSNLLHNYRNNYLAAGEMIDQIEAQLQLGGDFGDAAPPKLKKISSKVASAQSVIFKLFTQAVTGSKPGELVTDPLSKVQALGSGILQAIEILFVVLVSVTFALAIVGNIDVFVMGSGAINPLGPAMATIFLFVVPILLAFMATFMAIGGILAVYVPLIPYIIFLFGVIGWFISIVEAMIAGPIVALGILTPGGQSEVLGRAEPALMLLFGIFLRPSLMVFGMMTGMLLAIVAVTIVNASFSAVIGQISSQSKTVTGSMGFLELVFFMAAYVMLIVAVLNKSFSLIHIIPERVLRWISGHGEHEGVHEALGEVKGGVSAAAQRAAGASQQTQMPAKAARSEQLASKGREKEGAATLKPTETKPPEGKG